MVQLSASDGSDRKFSSDVFEHAMRWLHNEGGFRPDMLDNEAARNVIEETYHVFQDAMAVGVADNVIPPVMSARLEQDLFIFSGFKTTQELKEAASLLRNEDGTIKPFSTFLQDVRQIDESYNVHYLEAEYNFAVSSAQMAVRWADVVENPGYNLQYRTMGDEKVREEHAALNGITLQVDDPFWDWYFPPNGWNCRCTTVQVRQDKYPESDSNKALVAGNDATSQPKQQIFRFNPGKSAQIFPPHHPYYKLSAEVRTAIDILIQAGDRERLLESPTIKKLIEHFEKESLEIASELNALQKACIADYTDYGFRQLNRYLGQYETERIRGSKEFFDAYARVLEDALHAKKTVYVGEVYRQARLPQQTIDRYTNHMVSGQPMPAGIFTSTSYDPGETMPGNVRFIIQSRQGVKIEDLSAFASEKEVLFPPSAQFKVTEVITKDDKIITKLEEL